MTSGGTRTHPKIGAVTQAAPQVARMVALASVFLLHIPASCARAHRGLLFPQALLLLLLRLPLLLLLLLLSLRVYGALRCHGRGPLAAEEHQPAARAGGVREGGVPRRLHLWREVGVGDQVNVHTNT